MLKFKPSTEEALRAGRVRCFVFFDFLFLPMRVHCGKGDIEWGGHDWNGSGNVLKTNLSFSTTSISSSLLNCGHSGYHRGHVTASLPLNDTTREVVGKGYYRDRKMELFLCSLDQQGIVIERVAYAVGTIIRVAQEDNVVTFTAEDDRLDGGDRKDERRRKTIEDVRKRFSSELLHTASTSGVGWSMNTLAALVGNWLGVALDVLGLVRRDKRRAVAQRWQARRRTYWFVTTPRIPRKWRRKRGYPVRADTLAEAKDKLYWEVANKIWLFPRGWINMIVEVEGTAPELFNLDRVRETTDPERRSQTDPLREWGRGESDETAHGR